MNTLLEERLYPSSGNSEELRSHFFTKKSGWYAHVLQGGNLYLINSHIPT